MTRSQADPFDDLDRAFSEAYGASVPTVHEAKARRSREKRSVGAKDGRSAKWTGRTVQFNSRVKPDLKQRVIDASRLHGISMTALLEEALNDVLAKLEKKGKRHA